MNKGRNQQQIKLDVDPDVFGRAKHPTTLLLQHLIDDGTAPVQWKDGKAPEDRDAKLADLETTAAVRVRGNTVEAFWQ